ILFESRVFDGHGEMRGGKCVETVKPVRIRGRHLLFVRIGIEERDRGAGNYRALRIGDEATQRGVELRVKDRGERKSDEGKENPAAIPSSWGRDRGRFRQGVQADFRKSGLQRAEN